jgi:hypothetical protein
LYLTHQICIWLTKFVSDLPNLYMTRQICIWLLWVSNSLIGGGSGSKSRNKMRLIENIKKTICRTNYPHLFTVHQEKRHDKLWIWTQYQTLRFFC